MEIKKVLIIPPNITHKNKKKMKTIQKILLACIALLMGATSMNAQKHGIKVLVLCTGTYYYWIYYKENRKEVVGPQSTPLFTVKLENPTAIRGVDDRKSTNDDAIYDLQGRKVMTHSSFLTPHLKKGLYIHHGKKYMK